MKAFVHFLIRNPDEPDTMVYPVEVAGAYHGYPGFFLLDDGAPDIRDTYAFLAVHRGKLMTIRLDRVANTRTVYRADVANVGAFEFRALPLRNQRTRVLGNGPFVDRAVLRELKPRLPADLNAAVRQHDFYFVGYSSQLNDYAFAGLAG